MSEQQTGSEERIERLEQQIAQLNDSLQQALRSGTRSDSERVDRQQQRIEDEFSPEERRMVQEHREWSAFERNMSRWEQAREERRQVEKAQRRAARRQAGDDGDDDQDPKKPKTGKKEKATAAKAKPPGRHSAPGDEDEPASTDEKREPWWRRD